MKKRNLKQFLKENWGWFVFGIWICLIYATIKGFVDNSSTSTKITLIVVLVIYTVAGIAMLVKAANKWAKQEAEAKEKRLLELKERYKKYVDLVNAQVPETLIKLEKELLNAFEIDTSLEYLISFENYKNWICENRIVGKPDSFILATCLIYSIIDNPIIVAKRIEESAELKDIQFSINLDIAINCAFKIISEPTTYHKENSVWVAEKHPKVNIVVPKGIIKNTDLNQRIIGTIYYDEMGDKRTSVMQFSNQLHLIYLNCQ